MTTDLLQSLLNRLNALRTGSTLSAACPLCQPDQTDADAFKLSVTQGDHYPLLVHCHRCCVSKPQDDDDRLHNRRTSRLIYQAAGATEEELAAIYARMATPEIRSLWQSVGVNGRTEGESNRADDDTLHAHYWNLLNALSLSDRHRRWLEKKGLDADEFFTRGYRTAPDGVTAKALAKGVGEGVPGCVAGERWLCREGALLIPCRSEGGLIGAIKQRLTDGGRSRMRLLSGGGAKAKQVLHWPVGSKIEGDFNILWITEGERKADALLSGSSATAVVGLPGCGCWQLAIEPAVRAGVVVLAMDNDDAGRKCEQQLGFALAKRSVRVLKAQWEGAKGIDDAYAGGLPVEVVQCEAEGGDGNQTGPPQPKKSGFTRGRALKDTEVIPYLRQFGPLLRSEVKCYQPLLSELIRRGQVRMTKTREGQVVEAVDEGV
jgi:hypothetical protein